MNASEAETITVLCYGNPAREDDGLGPELGRRLETMELPGVRVETDYQLMVEDAALIADSSLVVFADASVDAAEPFSFSPVAECEHLGYMAHSIEPEELLGLTRSTFGCCPPAYALAIRGYSFEMFKEGLTAGAAQNLDAALRYLRRVLDGPGEVLRHRAAGVGEQTSGGLK